MTFDLYADLIFQNACPKERSAPAGLVSGFVDGCTSWFAHNAWKQAHCERRANEEANEQERKKLQERAKKFAREKENARTCYRKTAASLSLEPAINRYVDQCFGSDPEPLLPGWLAIKITFRLTGPWYSKDDRPFHVFDNPLRKDRVFGVPFMAAASWKGLLRWAMGMKTGLIGPEPVKDERKRREAELTVLHLFGNEKGERDRFQRGALAFYPTWFSKIGFEVINPHSRKTRAGTQPILYEVVPAGTEGTLKLLYAPLPDAERPAQLDRPAAICKLLDAARDLLTVYGFSAKRTAGWGAAEITAVCAKPHSKPPLTLSPNYWDDVKARIAELVR